MEEMTGGVTGQRRGRRAGAEGARDEERWGEPVPLGGGAGLLEEGILVLARLEGKMVPGRRK